MNVVLFFWFWGVGEKLGSFELLGDGDIFGFGLGNKGDGVGIGVGWIIVVFGKFVDGVGNGNEGIFVVGNGIGVGDVCGGIDWLLLFVEFDVVIFLFFFCWFIV